MFGWRKLTLVWLIVMHAGLGKEYALLLAAKGAKVVGKWAGLLLLVIRVCVFGVCVVQ